MKSFASALGANPSNTHHVIKVYIPSHDKRGNTLSFLQDEWSSHIGTLLTQLAGGCTIIPAWGAWFNEASGETVWETPLLAYAHISSDHLQLGIAELRKALHSMGRDMKQATVAFELDGRLHTINQFDGAKEKEHANAA